MATAMTITIVLIAKYVSMSELGTDACAVAVGAGVLVGVDAAFATVARVSA